MTAWAPALLEWFRVHQRDLPWRRDPSPYATWVSEMMLQQTQVATVVPYFERWIARFPSVEALASADEQDVLHAWQGLGYYSRARNLLRGARAVAAQHGGAVPDSVPELLKLPGVGPYTAGAIASIAYNVPAPIVDGNVTRVFCRLHGLRGDPKQAPLSARIWQLAGESIPEGHAGEFNQALMELGACVCTPVGPRCGDCPVSGACEARRLGLQEQLPETAPRPRVTAVRMVAALVPRGEALLLVQRFADETRWAGMWQFPAAEVRPEEPPDLAVRRAVAEAVQMQVTVRERVSVIRHGVTRFRITLEAFHCDGAGAPGTGNCQRWAWVPTARLGEYPMPAAHRKLAGEPSRLIPHHSPVPQP